jgi:hypothetical protein
MSPISCVFEGTNEKGRLPIAYSAMKRAMKGDSDLFGQAEKVYHSLQSMGIGKIYEDFRDFQSPEV